VTARVGTVLPRTDLPHPDGRVLHLYGAVHGSLGEDLPRLQPAALHQRLDALTGDWVAVSPSRNTRPLTHAATRSPACPLCPGGPEVPFDYDAAVFENRFPSLVGSPPEVPDGPAHLLARSTGRCEVVLYTSQHTGSVATLTPAQVARVFAIWRDRSAELFADPAIAAVLVFENRGEEVGATLSHPHGQIYAFDRLPPITARRVSVLERHRAEEGACLSCAVVATDDASQRVVATSEHFTVAVPFAARWPYEVHVRARRHGCRRLPDLTAAEQAELARLLQEVVRRYDALYGFELPYLCTVQQAPTVGRAAVQDWHLSLELLPPHRGRDKLKVRASVETATGAFINDTLPETSAAELAALDVPQAAVADYAAIAIEPAKEPT
jgi:UDPglucose--hexose-1-phosphate uridylyltransferase